MSSAAAISLRLAGPAPKCRPSWTISRTPYSPFVLNATAPVPWKEGRCAGVAAVVSEGVRRRSSIPSDLVGIECTNAISERQTTSGYRAFADGRQACPPRPIVPIGARDYGASRCHVQWDLLLPSSGISAVALDPSLLMTARASRASFAQPNRNRPSGDQTSW
jgi:hypothetical protein